MSSRTFAQRLEASFAAIDSAMAEWQPLRAAGLAKASGFTHGDMPKWLAALDGLAEIAASEGVVKIVTNSPAANPDAVKIVTNDDPAEKPMVNSVTKARAAPPDVVKIVTEGGADSADGPPETAEKNRSDGAITTPETAPGSTAQTPQTDAAIRDHLMALHPWRKGPLTIGGVQIDTEWGSDLKWQRFAQTGTDFTQKTVLDIGCGNGFYMREAALAGAQAVVGIDPTWLFLAQCLAWQREAPYLPVGILPLTLEEMPETGTDEAPLPQFDIVLSAGVLGHRRDPFAHLADCRRWLKPGGRLILETLVVTGDDTTVLVPEGRYADMRNTWFLPSAAALTGWLRRAGFTGAEVHSDVVTTTDEQRATPWMTFLSLSDRLDPADPSRTTEGHPAPRRAVLTAERPA